MKCLEKACFIFGFTKESSYLAPGCLWPIQECSVKQTVFDRSKITFPDSKTPEVQIGDEQVIGQIS